MSEMIDRVSKAIAAKMAPCLIGERQVTVAEIARAAIEAMRDEDLESILRYRRFSSKVSIDDSTGCHNWTGPVDKRDGYGRVYFGDGKTRGAHQFSYQFHCGEVPSGKVIDHECRNRRCVNPKHLRCISNAENVMCGEGITAINAQKEYCKHGHSLSGENLYVRPNGERDCRACRLEATRRHKRKRKAALQD